MAEEPWSEQDADVDEDYHSDSPWEEEEGQLGHQEVITDVDAESDNVEADVEVIERPPELAGERSKPCEVCTFLNFPSAKRCTMCKTAFEAATASEKRSCPRCTSFNDTVASSCVICGFFLSPEAPPDTAALPPKTCSSCTSINNASADVCVVCGGSLQTNPTEKECSRCTFLNNWSDHVCAICKCPLDDPVQGGETGHEGGQGGQGGQTETGQDYAGASSSSARAAPPTAINFSSCHACNNEFPMGCYGLTGCSHSFCRDCIVNHVAECMLRLHEKEDSLFQGVSCPLRGCGMVLSRQDIRVIGGMNVLRFVDSSVYGYVVRSLEESDNKLPVDGDAAIAAVQADIQMLKDAYEARLNVKVPKVKRRPPKRPRHRLQRIDTTVAVAAAAAAPEEPVATAATKEIETTEAALADVLRKLADVIKGMDPGDGNFPFLVTVLMCSDLTVWNVLGWLLRNDSTMDIVEHADLYFQAFALFRALSRPELLPMLCSNGPGHDFWTEEPQPGSLMALFENLHKQAAFILGSQVNSGMTFEDDNSAVEGALVAEAKYVFEELRDQVTSLRTGLSSFAWVRDADEYFKQRFPTVYSFLVDDSSSAAQGGSATGEEPKGKEPVKEEEKEYVSALKPFQFGQAQLMQSHYFREEIQWEMENPGRARRISKEIAGLATNLPLEFHSSIHVRVDEFRMDLLKALIIGPHGTPYQDGVFLFDILLGHNYPDSPPKVQFLTTGGGKVRFNPNLYHCGKVCLSLLGTWSGPSWQPGVSTVLQVLVSLQSLVFVNDPYYNEPGFSTTGGRHAKFAENYNKEQMYNTLVNSMLPALREPDAAFQDVIQAHFRAKRRSIEEQCDEWSKLSLPSPFTTRTHDRTNSQLVSFKEAAMEVKKELAARFGS